MEWTKSFIKRFIKNQQGNGIILTIAIIFVLFAVGGLVVDMGILYKSKVELQKAADAAALSGAQVITAQGSSGTEKVIRDVLKQSNTEQYIKNGVYVNPNRTTEIALLCWPKGDIRLTLEKKQRVYFMRIFGVQYVTLTVGSSVVTGPMGEVKGVMPIAISDKLPGTKLSNKSGVYWKNHVFIENDKVGNVSFNVLDLGQSAGTEYSGLLKLGDTVTTRSSNTTDYQGLKSKINSEIYVVFFDETTQKITGFGLLKLNAVDEAAKKITGEFMEKNVTGVINDKAVASTVFSIELVK